MRRSKAGRAGEGCDFIFLEQTADTAGELFDNFIFAALHHRHINLRFCDTYTVIGQQMTQIMVVMRTVEQCLGGNAADIQASPAG